MISRSHFIEQIETVQKFDKQITDLQDFGIDLIESPLNILPSSMFDVFTRVICVEEGGDLIYWWLYEDVPKIIWEGEKEIHLDTIDDLYDYLKTNNLFKQ